MRTNIFPVWFLKNWKLSWFNTNNLSTFQYKKLCGNLPRCCADLVMVFHALKEKKVNISTKVPMWLYIRFHLLQNDWFPPYVWCLSGVDKIDWFKCSKKVFLANYSLMLTLVLASEITGVFLLATLFLWYFSWLAWTWYSNTHRKPWLQKFILMSPHCFNFLLSKDVLSQICSTIFGP